jgi:predicted nucleotidyltransferase
LVTREISPLERLFASRVRVRLIGLFVLHPQESYHIRALESLVGARYSAVWKELGNLEQAGLLMSEAEAGRKFYRLNPSYPLLPELRHILLKTVAVGDLVREALRAAPGVEAAFIFGSMAGSGFDARSDVDLMVVGDVELAALASAVAALERRLSRNVNYVLYTSDEWRARLRAEDPFVTHVATSPKVMLIGDEDALRRTD